MPINNPDMIFIWKKGALQSTLQSELCRQSQDGVSNKDDSQDSVLCNDFPDTETLQGQ